MPPNHTSIAKVTLITGLFYHQGWRYYFGPKIMPSSSDTFPTKEEATAHLQQEIEHLVASLAPQWDVTIERKEW